MNFITIYSTNYTQNNLWLIFNLCWLQHKLNRNFHITEMQSKILFRTPHIKIQANWPWVTHLHNLLNSYSVFSAPTWALRATWPGSTNHGCSCAWAWRMIIVPASCTCHSVRDPSLQLLTNSGRENAVVLHNYWPAALEEGPFRCLGVPTLKVVLLNCFRCLPALL